MKKIHMHLANIAEAMEKKGYNQTTLAADLNSKFALNTTRYKVMFLLNPNKQHLKHNFKYVCAVATLLEMKLDDCFYVLNNNVNDDSISNTIPIKLENNVGGEFKM